MSKVSNVKTTCQDGLKSVSFDLDDDGDNKIDRHLELVDRGNNAFDLTLKDGSYSSPTIFKINDAGDVSYLEENILAYLLRSTSYRISAHLCAIALNKAFVISKDNDLRSQSVRSFLYTPMNIPFINEDAEARYAQTQVLKPFLEMFSKLDEDAAICSSQEAQQCIQAFINRLQQRISDFEKILAAGTALGL